MRFTEYKLSLITPTHGTPYLTELYISIKNQTYDNWEWILLLNGDFKMANIPIDILDDIRVKIYEDNTGNSNIGYLKNKAFSFATGDIVVEMDHDDLILENCLEELNKAYQYEDVGFVWSDNIIYNMKNDFVPYNSACGWTYKMFDWNGKSMYCMDGFKHNSRSLAFIWYAPDHIRSWRKSVYDSIGGHDETLSVLDDQDIMARTYLVTRFFHIEKPLYVYRVTGENTWIQRNQSIQLGTHDIFKKYAYALAERDADLSGLLKVDLGGGLFPRPGYITIDLEDADIVCDLNEGIPLPDNSVSVINAHHVLEHLKDPLKSMSEIHRVLADGGWAMIDVPSTDGRGAWMDPSHVSFWNENSFLYYTKKDQAQYIRNKTIRFQSFRCETHFPNQWYKEKDIPVVTAWLVAIKNDNRRPHPIEI